MTTRAMALPSIPARWSQLAVAVVVAQEATARVTARAAMVAPGTAIPRATCVAVRRAVMPETVSVAMVLAALAATRTRGALAGRVESTAAVVSKGQIRVRRSAEAGEKRAPMVRVTTLPVTGVEETAETVAAETAAMVEEAPVR